ncbi:MAG: TIGR01777 family oxidoreductase, partial [Myxococcota bacterium]
MTRVAVTGASGLVGNALCPALVAAGHQVVKLVRRAPAGPDEVRWAPERHELDPAALGPVDVAVHLAGENVGDGRWTDARKAAIRGSRVDGTRTLVSALCRLEPRPAALVSASAIGYYGAHGDEELDESAAPGSDFLAEVCQAGEAETEPARAAGLRVARLRLGVVLSPDGGALPKLLTPFKLGVGGKIGGGQQWMSWVGLDDVVAAFVRAVGDAALDGPINVTAPVPVTQAELAKT